MSKKIFITGGSRGIGFAIAKEFAQNQCEIYINYVNDDITALKAQQQLEKAYGVKVTLIKADISQEIEVKKLADQYREIPFDCIVNNAGIAIDTTLEDKTVENFQKVLNTNLIGTFLISKYFGQMMVQHGYGNIINITSTDAIDTYYPEGMDYAASKAGVISLTHTFAKMYAPTVAVNAIAAGWVDTDMNANMDSEFRKEQERKILLHRFARPEEIASVVYFLTTDGASYIQDSIIRVDGGVNH